MIEDRVTGAGVCLIKELIVPSDSTNTKYGIPLNMYFKYSLELDEAAIKKYSAAAKAVISSSVN
ncbi:MAG: hypothetical protein LBL00_04720 [Endomicrobium sp.]|nr:hypothetical protein [Endomicrobium sp.]